MLKQNFALLILLTLFLCQETLAKNWAKALGLEQDYSTRNRVRLFGLLQAEYQHIKNTQIKAGPYLGENLAANQVGADKATNSSFFINRARIGLRGAVDKSTNYLFITELGNNGVTNSPTYSPRVINASITYQPFKITNIQLGLMKTPGSEEAWRVIYFSPWINYSNSSQQLLNELYLNSDGSITGISNSRTGSVGAFRDLGIMIFDDLPIKQLTLSYAFMLGNGNGIHSTDNDKKKDKYIYLSLGEALNGSDFYKYFSWYQHGSRSLMTTSGTSLFRRERFGAGYEIQKNKFHFLSEFIGASGVIFNGTDGGAIPGTVGGTNIASFNLALRDKAYGAFLDLGHRVHPNLSLNIRYEQLERATKTVEKRRRFRTTSLGMVYHISSQSKILINYEFRDASAPKQDQSSTANKILNSLEDRFALQFMIRI